MEVKMYQNKCKTCGTTTVTMKKLCTCEACGSDDLIYSRYGKQLDVKALIIKILFSALVVGVLLALVFI